MKSQEDIKKITLELLENACSFYKLESKNQAGSLNLMQLNSSINSELLYSKILAYLLNPNEKHNHREYGKQFVKILIQKGIESDLGMIKEVYTEYHLRNNRRIDILIKTNTSTIIIENKIGAEDQIDQLTDYYNSNDEFAKNSDNVYLIYLTPYGSDPSDNSLKEELKVKLIENNRFFLFSYKEDIHDWLNSLNTKNNNEEVLYSAIKQFTDSIEIYCRMKGINTKMHDKIMITLNEKLKEQDPIEKINSTIAIRDAIFTAATHQFILDYFLALEKTIIKEIESREEESNLECLKDSKIGFIFHQQIVTFTEWENELKKSSRYLGLEMRINDNIGIGLELQKIDLLKPKDIIYGIMNYRHKETDEIAELNKNTHYELKKDSDWWVQYTQGCEPFTKALFYNEVTSDIINKSAKLFVDDYIDAYNTMNK